MLDFEEWDKTNVVIVDETHSKEPLRIRSRKSHISSFDMKISFEKAFQYAKEFGWNFRADESLSSVKIYLELQKELDRSVRDYVQALPEKTVDLDFIIWKSDSSSRVFIKKRFRQKSRIRVTLS